jgi:hypothetical protein
MCACRNSWPFVLIGFWKLSMSFSLGLVGIVKGVSDRRKEGRRLKPGSPLAATALYIAACILGPVGLLKIVKDTWMENRDIRIVTYVFCASFCLPAIGGFVMELNRGSCWDPLLVSAATTVSYFWYFSIFYSDWILAAIEGNWSGIPDTRDEALYWMYFGAKRLPMLAGLMQSIGKSSGLTG